MTPVQLTADLIESFAGTFISPRYDNRAATPQLHRDAWSLYSSDEPQVMCIAPREHAKAQSLDSRVMTPTGSTRVGDLAVGDYVIGRDGYPTRVTQLHPITEMELFRLVTKDGRSAICNAEHLWSVYISQNTGKKLVTISTRELMKKGFRQHRADLRSSVVAPYKEGRAFLPLHSPVHFYRIDEPPSIPPYMLGVWLGDGHTADGRITSADPEIFQWFDSPVIKQKGDYLYKVEGFQRRLKEVGFLGEKFIPGLYLVASPEARLELLQGLMDTDGTLHQDGNIAYFCNTNASLVEGVVFIVRSLGGVAYVSTTEEAKGASKISWRVSVKLSLELCPFRLSRKARGWKGSLEMKLGIAGIFPVKSALGRCISVAAADGLYLTEDFLVTHNSTALTTVYTLAEVLFRASDYVILISSTEEFAAEQLGNIAEELRSNEDLVREFGIAGFEIDTRTDIIIKMLDGHRFRILCRGAEQRIRGRLWKGKRPNLLVCDDMEDDEQVENKDRRDKFARWFFRAAKQALGRYGKTRVHGTILHEDSLLSKLRKNKSWKHLYFKAHTSFDDFSNTLWPEQWPESRLRQRRQEFIDASDTAGYSQEFLNDPQDSNAAFLRRDDFLPMTEADHETPKSFNVGWDFAVSKADLANRTSCTVAGKDVNNLLHFVDFRVGRWNPSVSPAEKVNGDIGWIDLMFEVDARWHPETHFVEGGVIWNAVKNIVMQEMQTRDRYLNISVLNPVKDKAARGLSLKKRHRAGVTRWNTAAEGYESAQEEMLRFTGYAAARADDQFDSAATLCMGLDLTPLAEEEDFYTQEEQDLETGFWNSRRSGVSSGRSTVTGY